MKTLFKSIVVAASLLAAVSGNAQRVGRQVVFNNLQLVGGATNSYAPGSYAGFNSYIGCTEYDKISLMLSSTTALPTNATGNIIARLAKSDSVTTEATPSVVLVLPVNSTNNNAVYSAVDTTGVNGLYVTSLESSNLVVAGVPVANITNFVSLTVNYQIVKRGAIPESDQQ